MYGQSRADRVCESGRLREQWEGSASDIEFRRTDSRLGFGAVGAQLGWVGQARCETGRGGGCAESRSKLLACAGQRNSRGGTGWSRLAGGGAARCSRLG